MEALEARVPAAPEEQAPEVVQAWGKVTEPAQQDRAPTVAAELPRAKGGPILTGIATCTE